MISVVMSTYREPEAYLRAAVESICAQTVTDWEFLIVVDEPHNDTARRLLHTYADRDQRITVLENERNRGLVYSLNRALAAAQGEYIARMDADDIAVPTRLEAQLAYLQQQRLDLVGTLTERIDEHGQSLGIALAPPDTPDTVMACLRIAPCVPHPTWFFRREVYHALGGYRNIDRCEDYDWLLRALKHGFRIGICPQPLLQYRVLDTSLSRSALLQQHLSSRYLAAQYPRIEEVTPLEVQAAVSPYLSDAAAARYRRADRRFTAAVQHRRQLLKCGGYLAASLLSSRHQWRRLNDIRRMHAVRRNSV